VATCCLGTAGSDVTELQVNDFFLHSTLECLSVLQRPAYENLVPRVTISIPDSKQDVSCVSYQLAGENSGIFCLKRPRRP
jgi:hypothetical protein